MRHLLWFLLLISAAPLAAQTPASDATHTLHALFDREWDYQMQQHPTRASSLGDRRWNDRWEDDSLTAIEARYQHTLAVLDEIKRVDRARLSPPEQINYDLFQRQHELAAEGHAFHWYLVPLNQRGGIQTANELGDALRFTTVKDYEDWIARLQRFPEHMDQTIALMRQGIRERIVLPKVIMERVPAQIEKQIVQDPQASAFYKPFRNFPAAIAEADRQRLATAAQKAIREQLVPSFQRFHDFFVKDYLPACYDQVGIWQLPRGGEMYAYFVREYTTTGLTPQQVHQMGLDEVKRIRGEMEAIKEIAGFKGSMAEFFQFLRSDPRFFYKNPAELLEAYKALAKTIDPNLVKVFRTLPRAPYGVEPIPEISAPDTTTAYYRQLSADGSRPGTFFVNLYKPETRPKWEMMALTLHEAVPGHHLQIALAYEAGEQPKFRRYGGYGAFVEGWGLYAESLGDDMGLYTDPYSKFGQLTYEMWRAVRLVVDTGMHSMHWTRQQAIDYFMQNAPKAELDIVNEIDRYIAWPGQALGYKIGQMKIRELRERARRRLGPQFDLKEFHEVVLRNGALPLDVLEQNVNAWLAEKSKAATQPVAQ
ncbi:MAG: DUF885 domain-containing protein [Acidobacteriia bacterium]|nr:DUF885 domain-containing protein [Terriglobia bacterium]